MKTITIRELHMKTGEWVRQAASEHRVIVTDRGHPVAALVPVGLDDAGTPFEERAYVPGFEDLREVEGDATSCISEDRDRP